MDASHREMHSGSASEQWEAGGIRPRRRLGTGHGCPQMHGMLQQIHSHQQKGEHSKYHSDWIADYMIHKYLIIFGNDIFVSKYFLCPKTLIPLISNTGHGSMQWDRVKVKMVLSSYVYGLSAPCYGKTG